MQNYMVFNDAEGIYTYTFEYEKKVGCMHDCTSSVVWWCCIGRLPSLLNQTYFCQLSWKRNTQRSLRVSLWEWPIVSTLLWLHCTMLCTCMLHVQCYVHVQCHVTLCTCTMSCYIRDSWFPSQMKSPSITTVINGANKTLYIPVSLKTMEPLAKFWLLLHRLFQFLSKLQKSI